MTTNQKPADGDALEEAQGVTPMTQPDDYFGGCPQCGGNNGYLNVHCNHWMVCHAHRVRWSWGANLTSSWREETEEEWETNHRLLVSYREVEPIYDIP